MKQATIAFSNLERLSVRSARISPQSANYTCRKHENQKAWCGILQEGNAALAPTDCLPLLHQSVQASDALLYSFRFRLDVKVPRFRKINLEKVRSSLDKTCRKCGFTITPDLVKLVDSDQIECPKCGEKFAPASGRHLAN